MPSDNPFDLLDPPKNKEGFPIVSDSNPFDRFDVPKKYETSLSPQEEQQFKSWKSKYAPKDSGQDYDLRGAFKAGLTPDPQTGHWPDTFKKPNHPTFSDQSIYAKDASDKAGHWEGETFIPPNQSLSATANLTVYTPGKGNPKMEGGFQTSSGAPMYTLEAYDRGEAPYVTAAVHPDSPLKGHSLSVKIGSKDYPVKATDTGPGVSTIDLASENQKWATNAPEEFSKAEITTSAEHSENPFDLLDKTPSHKAREEAQNVVPETLSTKEEGDAWERVQKKSSIWKNAFDAAAEVITGMVPKHWSDVPSMLIPPINQVDQIHEAQQLGIKDIPIIGRMPEVIESERTPPGSKERFAAGFRMIADILQVAAMGKGMKGGEPIKPPTGGEPPIVPPSVPPSNIPSELPFEYGKMINAVRTPTGKIVGHNIEHGDVISGLSEKYDPSELTSGWVIKKSTRSATDKTFISTDDVQKTNGDFEAAFRARGALTGEPPTPPVMPPQFPNSGNIPPANIPSEVPNPVRGSGKFRMSYQVDKELGDMMESIGASRESGALKAEIASRKMLDELTPNQLDAFGKYLISRRLKTVNPKHPQILSDAEMAATEADPKIAKSLKTYVDEVKPDIEALRKRAGLSETAAADKEPEFISLMPKTDELLPESAAAVPTTAARLSRTTTYAKQALGLAKEYNTDLREVLRESYGEATRKARLADFYKAVKRKGLSDTERFEDLPPELAHDLRAATESKLRPGGPIVKAWQAGQRFSTAAALTANPAELINHMRRQLAILASKPPIGRGVVARLEAIVPYIGPKVGAFLRTVTDDMSKPENMSILQNIFDAGGGSSRSFLSSYKLRGKFSKWTGLQWLQGKTGNLLFGIPRGEGVGGWDLRMRVQLEKIRRAAEGNVDPQRIREFSNQIGQYGSHPDWPIEALRNVNPYAATTLPLRLTELKTAVGASGLMSKNAALGSLRTAETFLRGTGGTILGLSAANYMLSGRWPWENEPGHEFDLNTGVSNDDGKPVYLKLRVIAPELSRPVSTVGLPQLSREQDANDPQYLSAFMTGLANQGLSVVGGPFQDFLLTATTGKVPYLVKQGGKSPELMDIAKTKKGESRGVEQVKEAVAGVNPLGSVLSDRSSTKLPEALRFIERPVPGVRPFGSMFTTSYEKKEPTKKQRRPTLKQLRKKAIKDAENE